MSNKGKDSKLVKRLLIIIALAYLVLILIVPMVTVFINAFSDGLDSYIAAITDQFTIEALKLTLIAIICTIPINTIFGICAAWAITKFEFRGKNILLAILDLPFAVSPVIAGLIFVLLFSTNHGWFAEVLTQNNIKIIFSPIGIIIATLFITMPFIAKELIPVMESIGNTEEEAAMILGASGWKTFLKVTLPNIRWALFYGVILSTCRAAGEFGAVSVVSGHIRGYTNTIPLHVETLYNEYQFSSAFAVASILTVFAIINLVIKNIAAYKLEKDKKEALSLEENII